MVTFGVDISNWQAGISISRIASEGYQFCICKSSQGTYFDDALFDGWVPQARDNGMIPGAYHWIENGSGREQARKLFNRVTAHGGPYGMLIAGDVEDNSDWDTTYAFFNEWYQLTNHPIMLYTGGWWWSQRGWHGPTLSPYLWDSRYVEGTNYASRLYDNVPDGWHTPTYGGWGRSTMLQFTSHAVVAGYSIDANAFLGTDTELRALAGVGDGVPFIPNDQVGGYVPSGDADFVAANVPVPGQPGAVVGLHVATSSIWANTDEILKKLANNAPIASISDENIDKIVAGLAGAVIDVDAVAARLASLLAPQFRHIDQIRDALGRWGDNAGESIGKLNDPEA